MQSQSIIFPTDPRDMFKKDVSSFAVGRGSIIHRFSNSSLDPKMQSRMKDLWTNLYACIEREGEAFIDEKHVTANEKNSVCVELQKIIDIGNITFRKAMDKIFFSKDEKNKKVIINSIDWAILLPEALVKYCKDNKLLVDDLPLLLEKMHEILVPLYLFEPFKGHSALNKKLIGELLDHFLKEKLLTIIHGKKSAKETEAKACDFEDINVEVVCSMAKKEIDFYLKFISSLSTVSEEKSMGNSISNAQLAESLIQLMIDEKIESKNLNKFLLKLIAMHQSLQLNKACAANQNLYDRINDVLSIGLICDIELPNYFIVSEKEFKEYSSKNMSGKVRARIQCLYREVKQACDKANQKVAKENVVNTEELVQDLVSNVSKELLFTLKHEIVKSARATQGTLVRDKVVNKLFDKKVCVPQYQEIIRFIFSKHVGSLLQPESEQGSSQARKVTTSLDVLRAAVGVARRPATTAGATFPDTTNHSSEQKVTPTPTLARRGSLIVPSSAGNSTSKIGKSLNANPAVQTGGASEVSEIERWLKANPKIAAQLDEQINGAAKIIISQEDLTRLFNIARFNCAVRSNNSQQRPTAVSPVAANPASQTKVKAAVKKIEENTIKPANAASMQVVICNPRSRRSSV